MDVATYTEEFQKLCLRSRIQEDETVKVARYLGSLKWNIQEEISLWTPTIDHKCFQLALKVKEKNKKATYSKFRGIGREKDGRGQRGYGGRGSDSRPQGDNKLTEQQEVSSRRGSFNRGRGSNTSWSGRSKNQRRGSYFATMKCYHCNQLGHPTYRCSKK